MGKKDKHKLGQTRNNPVFKVATGKVSKQKGKAKEVTTKLKNISTKKGGGRDAVEKSDKQLKALQSKSVSMIGKAKAKGESKITPPDMLAKSGGSKAKIEELADVMDTTNMKS